MVRSNVEPARGEGRPAQPGVDDGALGRRPPTIYPDGVEVVTSCPYCGEDVTLLVDVTGGRRQDYVEDCWVCCRPMQIIVTVHARDEVDVDVRSPDE